MKNLLVIMLIFATICGFAQKGVNGIKIEGTYLGQSCSYEEDTGMFVMHLREDIMRYDVDFKEDKMGLIYQHSSGKMWILNHTDKDYFPIDADHMADVKSRLNVIREKIEEYKEKMPQKELKRMLAYIDITMLESYQNMNYENTGKKKKINGFKTIKKVGQVNDTIQFSQYYTVKSKVKTTSPYRTIISQLQEFTGDYLKLYFLHFPIYHFVPGPNNGFAIKTNRVVNGVSCFEYQTESISYVYIDDDFFKIPELYGMNSRKIPVW